MALVLLDTNFLMIPQQFGIDIFSEIERIVPEYELATLSGVVLELEKLKEAADKGKDKVAASIALELIKDVKVIESSGDVDKFILKFSLENDAVVCTNDRDLKKRLKKNGTRVIQMRGRRKLEFL